MLFERTTIIGSGRNPHLEESALDLFFGNFKGSFTFKEDGEGRLQSYDGNPKHLVCLSFNSIESYCQKHLIGYSYGEDFETGMDTLTVCKKEP